MKKRKKKKNIFHTLVLIPRFLAIFLTMAAYLVVSEIFSAEFQWSNFWLALVPGSVYLSVTIAAWKNSGLGGALFVFLATGLLFMEIIRETAFLPMYVIIGLTFIAGFLFIFFREKRAC